MTVRIDEASKTCSDCSQFVPKEEDFSYEGMSHRLHKACYWHRLEINKEPLTKGKNINRTAKLST